MQAKVGDELCGLLLGRRCRLCRALGARRGVLCKKSLGDLTEGARSLFDQWSVEVEAGCLLARCPKIGN
jgi:hypothetical protein